MDLLTHLEDMSNEDRLQHTLTSLLLVVDQARRRKVRTEQRASFTRKFVGRVLRHLAQLVCNGNAITSYLMQDQQSEAGLHDAREASSSGHRHLPVSLHDEPLLRPQHSHQVSTDNKNKKRNAEDSPVIPAKKGKFSIGEEGPGSASQKYSPPTDAVMFQEQAESTHKRAGLTDRIPGDIFHFHFIMVLLLLARKSELHYALAAEYAPNGKWDDVYLKYQENDGTWKHIYFQLKHSTGKTPIKLFDLHQKNLNFNVLLNSHASVQEKNKTTAFFVLYTNNYIEDFGDTDDIKLINSNETFTIPFIIDPQNCKKIYISPKKLTEIASNTNGITEVKIMSFLNDFLLVTNQPNAQQLEMKVMDEIGLLYNKAVQKYFYSMFLTSIQKWMADKSGTFITNAHLDWMLKNFLFQRCQPLVHGVAQPGVTQIMNRKVLKSHRRLVRET